MRLTRIRRDGYSYQSGNNVRVSEQEIGQKRRRKSTKSWARRTVPFRMSLTEANAFDSFMKNDLMSGILHFDWQPPELGAPAESRLVLEDGRNRFGQEFGGRGLEACSSGRQRRA